MIRHVTIASAAVAALALFATCTPGSPKRVSAPTPAPAAPTSAPAEPELIPDPAAERLASDTPRTTTEGNTFIAPAGWSVVVSGPATILESPEGGSHLVLVDVTAETADAAVAAAWQAYEPNAAWPLKVTSESPDQDGWTDRRSYEYQTSPDEKRVVSAGVRRANDLWTVTILNMDQGVLEKRLAQVILVAGQLLPKGYTRESFAGKTAHELEQARITQLGAFVEEGMKELRIPGVAVGIVQNGKVVFAGGFGVRQLGRKQKITADTLFMIASNTKALTTLMLAKLVDEQKLTWETPATSLLPSFVLGDAEATRQVRVKHLICACTGLPRQDLEWTFQFEGVTPADTMATLSTMQPTSGFGEMFQYSNPLAAAGGFVGGHVAFPKLELGAAYDKAMKTRVFAPLGMKSTTFDYARALRRNHAMPHAPNVDGETSPAAMEVNYAIIPARPAGAGWSNVRDVLAYVSMELAEGALPNGKQYVSKEALLARRAPQVPIGRDATYGMGLQVDTTYGVPVVHHGGDLLGFHSDMMWLPGQGVGAVVLTNGDPGWILSRQFQRKLLEVLFDGRPEADAAVAAAGKAFYDRLAAERKLLTVPAGTAQSEKLAPHYANDALGDITVRKKKGATVFDFGEWQSEVGSRTNPDGTVSFITVAPGIGGIDFVVGSGDKRTLTVRDAQHEYIFTEQ